jgi:acetylornithine deacetylase/succinyl-diaminopimelate desuccinylase-like protein
MTRAIENQSTEAELIAMLSLRRPAWSKTEKRLIKTHLLPLGLVDDSFGNLYKRIGDAPVLWSCHTDTVHRQGGAQTLSIVNDVVRLADKQSNCLGADDTAGMWLMMEMIRANKPGLYVFHRAEEIGGQGSDHIAECYPELFESIKYAIAFDRRGTRSIITHQAGGRCCSDTFASSLSKALGLGHIADAGGTFTDTANYTHLIGECTNVSVGYDNEHSKDERLDLAYLRRLRNALLAFDWTALEYSREPGDEDANVAWALWGDEDQSPRSSSQSLLSLVRDNPAEVADWLEEYGITAGELEEAIYQRGGVIRGRG